MLSAPSDKSVKTRVLDGRALSRQLEEALKAELEAHPVFRARPPRLDVIWVGERRDSESYVLQKKKAAERAGIALHLHHLPSSTSRAKLEKMIDEFNADAGIDGMIIQSPIEAADLPKEEEAALFARVDPGKDVDGFHPENQQALLDRRARLISCTPLGALNMIYEVRKNLSGLEAVVIGRSPHVGKPMAELLRQQGCAVTVMGRSTHNDAEKAEVCRAADIIVAAAGHKHMVTAAWVKPGATLIDIGLTAEPVEVDGESKRKLFGDIDFEGVQGIAGAVSPTPGGTGPMTVTALLMNTVIAAHTRRGGPTPVPSTALKFWQRAGQSI